MFDNIRKIKVLFSPVNNITAITDSLNAGQSQLFDYDALDRLSFATGGYGEQSFTYDGIGNRLSLETTQGGTTQTQTYQYDANSHRLNAIAGERTFTYDAAGNTINNGNATFTYNQRNRMNSATANGVTTSYEINALGQRVRKSSPAGDTQYIYNLSGRLIAEANANGEVQVEYAYLDGEPLTMWRDDQSPPEPPADYTFSSSGSATQGKWQVFQFEVSAGDLVEAEVVWDDPNANVRIFLRDETNTQIDNDMDGGLPATVSATTTTSGTYSIGVSIVSGAVNYDVLVNTTSEAVEPPDPVADYTFSSSGSTTQGKWQVFPFDVSAGDTVDVDVTWDDPAANLRIFLRDETNTQVANDMDGALPAMVSTVAQSSGTWSLGVSIVSGSVNYDVLVNTTPDETEPPDPVTNYNFSSSGSPTQGKWQVFPFAINAGESVDVDVTWNDPTANLRIFLRDETNTQVANDMDGALPAMVSTVAQSSGTWSLGVSIISGSVDYDVQVTAQGGQ
jgi:YD repeat-containing protein